MYIQKAEIKNIRSIKNFKIYFGQSSGWHVLIGDNGAGKSTIIRSIALALVGDESHGLRANWDDWLNKESKEGDIRLKLFRDETFDKSQKVKSGQITKIIVGNQIFSLDAEFKRQKRGILYFDSGEESAEKMSGFFSVAFGPYRRFEGGNEEWGKTFENPSFANLAAHLSVFGEDVAFTQTKSWLIGLFNTSNDPTLLDKERKDKLNQLEFIKKLVNSEELLPNNTKLESVNSKDVFFKDGNDTTISVNQMSDGYRSILSMTFELIRQLVRVYGSELVFKNIEKGEMFIDLPGVVLVDEIDAHLHPTWQTRIGQWFLKYFPKLQFIVTTHSPLVCRAAENGSIWRLAAPGSDEKSGEITGLDRERLIYGNVLDAYGTGVFGDNTSISEDSNDLLNRLSELNVKSMMGLINDEENEELEKLRSKFPTESALKK
jgi:predicted ATPase